MREQETRRPALAPNTKNLKSYRDRSSMSRDEYSKLLHTRSEVKQQKKEKNKQEMLEKELEECTFEPRINEPRKIVTTNPFAGTKINSLERIDRLKQPKKRVEKSMVDVEYER